MRILLDENIPVQLGSFLPGHQVVSVSDPSVGWKSIKNGLLLDRMEGRFDLLVTADRSMYAQQNLSRRAVSILVVPTNRRKSVINLASRIADVVAMVNVAQYAVLELSGEVVIKPHSAR